MNDSEINIVKRLSIGVDEPNVVPIGQERPEFANPYIDVQGIGRFYHIGDIPLAEAYRIRDELRANLDVARRAEEGGQ